jgi:tetratricopeptide (TPR) repeat protein
VGRILGALGPIRDKTLIVLTADHGEGLGEHEELTHGLFLYDSTIHVPCLISGPGIPGGKSIQTQTRSIDLAPTILSLTGLSSGEKRDGRSLLPLLMGKEWNEPQSISESQYPVAMGWSPLYAIRTSRWKYINAPHPELYDLAADPGETENVIEVQSAVAHQLSQKLLPYKEESKSNKKETVTDPELAEKLKSLGYVSGGEAPKDLASLPDPKDKTKVWNLYEESLFLFYDGKSEEAITKLERAIQLDSGIAVLYDTLARTAFRDEIEKSIAALQQALKLEPENARFHQRLSACYRKIRQFDSSVDEGKIAIQLDPQSTDALLGLGTTYLEMGQPQQALEYFQQLLQIDPKNASAIHQIGTVHRSLGDLTKAMEFYRRAIALNPNMPDPYNALGVVLSQTKDYVNGEMYLRKSIQIDPSFEEAYFNLGITYQRMGRKTDAIQAFQTFLDRADSRIYASRMEKARFWIQQNS